MKIVFDDVNRLRDMALDLVLNTPTPVYLNSQELPDRLNIPLCYMQATVAFLQSKGLLAEEVSFDLKRKSTDGIEDIA